MGLARIELATSRLSGVRSNQLSYRPSYLSVQKKGKEGERRRMREGLKGMNFQLLLERR